MPREIRTKTPAELAKMRRAGRVVAEALKLIEDTARPGMTTGELDAEVEALIRRCDAEPAFKGYQGFPASICASINEEVVHGIPGDRKLKKGDILSADIGALLDGYYGDAAITLGIGEILAEPQRLIKTTKKCLNEAIRCLKPGVKVSDISRAVQNCAEQANFYVVRKYTGHGIGSEMHEAPQIPNFVDKWRVGNDQELEVGTVLAIEPMLNVGTPDVTEKQDGWTVVTCDGELSAHFEHTVAIGEEGPSIMTVL